ncbi:Fructokinase [Candidatus Burkholderia crenata]|nr:Fructokinase [Candidatus Burkholderia crenata]
MATRIGQSFREPGTLIGPFASGAPAIFIDQVAKLGSPCSMIGCVGDDDLGVLNVERLRTDGVDVSGIGVLKDATTGSAFVTYREDGDRDFIYNITNSAAAQLSVANLREDLLAKCGNFHVMGSSRFSFRIIEAMKQAIETVKTHGGTASFDPNIRKEMLRIPEMRDAFDFILDYTDVFLPSGHEVTLLASATSERGATFAELDTFLQSATK